MKGYYDIKWSLHANAKGEPSKNMFKFRDLEMKMNIKFSDDLKDFSYRNSMGEYPDWGNYMLYDKLRIYIIAML